MMPDLSKLPYDLAAARAAARKSVSDYCTKHKACPQCGSTKTSQTYVGCIMPHIGEDGKVMNEDSYKDTNDATCQCGWSGIVHDLVPGD